MPLFKRARVSGFAVSIPLDLQLRPEQVAEAQHLVRDERRVAFKDDARELSDAPRDLRIILLRNRAAIEELPLL